jgi:hypothetical protein
MIHMKTILILTALMLTAAGWSQSAGPASKAPLLPVPLAAPNTNAPAETFKPLARLNELPSPSAVPAAGEPFKTLPRLDGQPTAGRGSPEQMARQGAQVKKMLNLYKTPAGRAQIAELMTVIRLANQQPEVRAKVDEARKLVHNYIRRVAPELLPTLETMNANRETVRQSKQATDMVY